MGQPWFADAKALLHVPLPSHTGPLAHTHTHTHFTHSITLIINHSTPSFHPFAALHLFPMLCPETHRQGNRRHSAPHWHARKVSENSHTQMSVLSTGSLFRTDKVDPASVIKRKVTERILSLWHADTLGGTTVWFLLTQVCSSSHKNEKNHVVFSLSRAKDTSSQSFVSIFKSVANHIECGKDCRWRRERREEEEEAPVVFHTW